MENWLICLSAPRGSSGLYLRRAYQAWRESSPLLLGDPCLPAPILNHLKGNRGHMEKTTARESFAESIGEFMHNCGAIEFVVNGAITELATDTILLDSVLRGPLSRRIDLLAALLRECTQTNPETIDALRRGLHRIRKDCNKVAHNQIIVLGKATPDSERIVVFRGAGDRETREE